MKNISLWLFFLTVLILAGWLFVRRSSSMERVNCFAWTSNGRGQEVRIVSWLYGGRVHAIAIIEGREQIGSVSLEEKCRDEILNLMDVKFGWGASRLKGMDELFKGGGFWASNSEGEIFGFVNKTKDALVIGEKNLNE
jgi:hypothetical protein